MFLAVEACLTNIEIVVPFVAALALRTREALIENLERFVFFSVQRNGLLVNSRNKLAANHKLVLANKARNFDCNYVISLHLRLPPELSGQLLRSIESARLEFCVTHD